MNSVIEILGGILGAVMLYYGADYLISGGVSLAKKLHIPTLVIGLTLVAFGTSAPELVVSIDAGIKGHGDIAAGNIIGSNICNVALILGLCSVICPLNVNKKLFKIDLPVLLGSAVLFSLFVFLTGGINRWQAAIFAVGLISYTLVRVFFDREDVEAEANENASNSSVLKMILSIIGGLAALVFGAKFFVNGAVCVARLCNVSEAIIGLTIVALGTSLPELATSVIASIKKEGDIAIGNIVGSNIFNILAIMGIAPLVTPLSTPGINLLDLAVMLLCSVLLIVFMRTGYLISRIEGIIFLVIYFAYPLIRIF